MTVANQTSFGLIAQLRFASRSPSALALGALLGGFVPVATFVTVHAGRLITYSADGQIAFASPTHPGWALVIGGLVFSAKTVYAWGCQAFLDRSKAAGFVLLVELALLLSPTPILGYAALVYLIGMNALGTGCALALRDLEDVSAPIPQPFEQSEPTQLAIVRHEPFARLQQIIETTPDRYALAIEYLSTVDRVSADGLRKALGCRLDTARMLVSRLEADGWLGAPDPSDHRRRPVIRMGVSHNA